MILDRFTTDILILGSGGAGLFAALHAHNANPDLYITVVSKGLLRSPARFGMALLKLMRDAGPRSFPSKTTLWGAPLTT